MSAALAALLGQGGRRTSFRRPPFRFGYKTEARCLYTRLHGAAARPLTAWPVAPSVVEAYRGTRATALPVYPGIPVSTLLLNSLYPVTSPDVSIPREGPSAKNASGARGTASARRGQDTALPRTPRHVAGSRRGPLSRRRCYRL